MNAQTILDMPLRWVLLNYKNFSPLAQLQLKSYGTLYCLTNEAVETTGEFHQPSPLSRKASFLDISDRLKKGKGPDQ